MDKKQTYRNMALIHYKHLSGLIDDYTKNIHTLEKQQEIIAYTFSTLACIVAYADNYLDKNSNSIKACKYAYNMLKHDSSVVTFIEFKGGFAFTIEFPVEIPVFEVKWEFQNFECKHSDQKDAFKKLFDKKTVIETLEPIINIIDTGENNNETESNN